MFSYTVNEEIKLVLHHPIYAEEFTNLVQKNKLHLSTYLPHVPDHDKTVEDTKKWFEESLSKYAKQEQMQCIIFFDQTIVGSVGFNMIDMKNKKAEIGYWLDKDCEGKGIVTNCVKALLDIGFEILKLNKIQIQASTQNIKSRNIPEKLGFKLDGIMRHDAIHNDIIHDRSIYSILKTEWQEH